MERQKTNMGEHYFGLLKIMSVLPGFKLIYINHSSLSIVASMSPLLDCVLLLVGRGVVTGGSCNHSSSKVTLALKAGFRARCKVFIPDMHLDFSEVCKDRVSSSVTKFGENVAKNAEQSFA